MLTVRNVNVLQFVHFKDPSKIPTDHATTDYIPVSITLVEHLVRRVHVFSLWYGSRVDP